MAYIYLHFRVNEIYHTWILRESNKKHVKFTKTSRHQTIRFVKEKQPNNQHLPAIELQRKFPHLLVAGATQGVTLGAPSENEGFDRVFWRVLLDLQNHQWPEIQWCLGQNKSKNSFRTNPLGGVWNDIPFSGYSSLAEGKTIYSYSNLGTTKINKPWMQPWNCVIKNPSCEPREKHGLTFNYHGCLIGILM